MYCTVQCVRKDKVSVDPTVQYRAMLVDLASSRTTATYEYSTHLNYGVQQSAVDIVHAGG